MTAKKAFTNLIAIFAVSILILEQSVWAVGIPLSNPISVNQIQNNLSATKSSADLRPLNLRETFEKDLRRFQENPTFESGNPLELNIVAGQKQSQKCTNKDGYDDIYQLTTVASSMGQGSSYIYDDVGNRSTVSDGTTTTTYTPNNLNQYTAVDSTSYSYDSNGNMTSDGVNTYSYDYENRLTAVASSTGQVARYGYDGFGRRISKEIYGPSSELLTTSYYFYDGANLITEYNSSWNLQRSYVYSDSIDDPVMMSSQDSGLSTKYYYHSDALGSITAITDSTGAVVETYKYDSFGAPSIYNASGDLIAESLVLNPYRFTGREYDSETEIYFYRARTYSSTLGRFLQTDPIGYYDSMNLYSYCQNNPINFVDPLGLWPESIHNDIIDDAFSGSSEDVRDAIKEGSQIVDSSQYQDPKHSYMHGMRCPGQTVGEAQRKMEKFIEKMMQRSKRLKCEGKTEESNVALGMALHPVMDSTSPSHEDFQVWAGIMLHIPTAYAHREAEKEILPFIKKRTIQMMKQRL